MDPEHHWQRIWGLSVRDIHIQVEAVLITGRIKTIIDHPSKGEVDIYLRADLILCESGIPHTAPGICRKRGVESKVTKGGLCIWNILQI